jgi:hypothetical protein
MKNVLLIAYTNLIILEISLSIPFTLYCYIFEKSLYGGKPRTHYRRVGEGGLKILRGLEDFKGA